MPDMGKLSAACVAASMSSSFTNIKVALVVGICGGVPFRPDNQREIILGDVVISQALVQFDLGRQHPDSFQPKIHVEESLGRAGREMRSLLAKLKTSLSLEKLQEDTCVNLQALQEKLPQTAYPGSGTDRLYEPSYLHKHRPSAPGPACELCGKGNDRVCDIARSMTCEDLGCEDTNLIPRRRLRPARTLPNSNTPANLEPQIHFGRMGSADTVMKSGKHRDQIAKQADIIVFEMEGAGVWDHFPNSLVIKSVCDYADSHKNKRWQYYAAATAAACAKSVLNEWVPAVESSGQGVSYDEQTPHETNAMAHLSLKEPLRPLWHIPFVHEELPDLVGHSDTINTIGARLFRPNRHGKVTILGLGGVGKSRLALELAHFTRAKRRTCSVFWIQATDTLTLERDFLAIGKLLNVQGVENGQADVKNLVKKRLSEDSSGEWLLIVDNADDESLWGKKSNQTPDQITLDDYLPSSSTGAVLITTRNRHVATNLAGKDVVEIYEVDPGEAEEILRNLLEKPEILVAREETGKLLYKLTYLPLAIVQAASYINENDETIRTYLRLLEKPEDEVLSLLSEDFNDQGRYKAAHITPVATTWLVSFQQIQDRNPLATEYLAFMSCLSEKNIPQSLLPEAPSEKEKMGALAALRGYGFLRRQDEDNPLGPLYDMHRLVRLATRNWLKIQHTLLEWTEKTFRQLVLVFPFINWTTKGVWDLYMPHAQVLCDSGISKDLAERYGLLLRMSICLNWTGKYNEALKAIEAAVDWRKKVFGEDHSETIAAYFQYAVILITVGRLTEAEELLRLVVDWEKRNLGPEHDRSLESLYRLGSTYFEQCRYRDAEELFSELVTARMKAFGRHNGDTLRSMDYLARTYLHLGRYDEAEELQLKVFGEMRALLGENHLDTLYAWEFLGSIYFQMNRLDEAEKIRTQALESKLRKFFISLETVPAPFKFDGRHSLIFFRTMPRVTTPSLVMILTDHKPAFSWHQFPNEQQDG